METLFDATSVIHAICNYLETAFQQYKWSGFLFKTTDNTAEAKLATPKVYRLVCPPDDINDSGFPVCVPSVTVMLSSSALSTVGEMSLRLELHTALVSPSVADAEKAVPDSEHEGQYVIDENTEYTRENAQRELYQSCIIFTSRIARILRASPFSLGDISITPPEPSLPDFPFITSRIDTSYAQVLPKAVCTATETDINTFINEWL